MNNIMKIYIVFIAPHQCAIIYANIIFKQKGPGSLTYEIDQNVTVEPFSPLNQKSILTPETWQRTSRQCYTCISNMKAVGLVVWEKIFF